MFISLLLFSLLFLSHVRCIITDLHLYIADFFRVLSRVTYPGTCLSCRCFHWFRSFHMCFSLLLFIFLLLFETFEIQEYQITNVAFCLPIFLFSSSTIACFTETHVDNSILDNDITLDGFTSIQRKNRNSFGSGVIIYLSNAVSAFRREDLEPNNIECIWLEIDNTTCKYFLCCFFRPPHTHSTFCNL